MYLLKRQESIVSIHFLHKTVHYKRLIFKNKYKNNICVVRHILIQLFNNNDVFLSLNSFLIIFYVFYTRYYILFNEIYYKILY